MLGVGEAILAFLKPWAHQEPQNKGWVLAMLGYACAWFRSRLRALVL